MAKKANPNIQKLGNDRMSVLKALHHGGRVEKSRAYPYEPTFHLIRHEDNTPPPVVKDLVIADLITRGLNQSTRQPDLSNPSHRSDADALDYVITPLGQRTVQLKGIPCEDLQQTLFGNDVGRRPQTTMEAA